VAGNAVPTLVEVPLDIDNASPVSILSPCPRLCVFVDRHFRFEIEKGFDPEVFEQVIAENAIRPFVVGRKNWLFAGSPSGADAAATLYGLIETAMACRIEPYQYLRFLFENLPLASTEADYAALLPQNAAPELIAAH